MLPSVTCSDVGTETGLVASCQCFLRRNSGDDFAGEKSHKFVKSTTNQVKTRAHNLDRHILVPWRFHFSVYFYWKIFARIYNIFSVPQTIVSKNLFLSVSFLNLSFLLRSSLVVLVVEVGNATLTISFPFGTSVNQTSKPSSNKRTYITRLSNSRPKYLTLIMRLCF